MEKYKIIFDSLNIDFVEVNNDLINDYLLMINDEEIQKRISTNRRVYTYDDELSWLKDKINNNASVFSMIEKNSGSFIGNVEIMNIENKTGELGICITPKFQDKHYGSEAISRMIKYGFEELDLDEIILVVFSNNLRAVHCYKKAGFVEYKKVLNVTNIDGEDVDDIYMSLKRK